MAELPALYEDASEIIERRDAYASRLASLERRRRKRPPVRPRCRRRSVPISRSICPTRAATIASFNPCMARWSARSWRRDMPRRSCQNRRIRTSRSGSASSADFSASTRTGRSRSRDGSRCWTGSGFTCPATTRAMNGTARPMRRQPCATFRAGPAVARRLAAHHPGRRAPCPDLSRNRHGQGFGATRRPAARRRAMRFLGTSGHQRISDHRLFHQQRSDGARGRRRSLFRTAGPAASTFRSTTSRRMSRPRRPTGRSSGCAPMPWSIGAASRCQNICRNMTRCLRASPPKYRGCQFVFIEFAGGSGVTAMFRSRLERAFKAVGLDASDHCVFLPRLAPDRFRCRHRAMRRRA